MTLSSVLPMLFVPGGGGWGYSRWRGQHPAAIGAEQQLALGEPDLGESPGAPLNQRKRNALSFRPTRRF
jgi:hypothetical protein